MGPRKWDKAKFEYNFLFLQSFSYLLTSFLIWWTTLISFEINKIDNMIFIIVSQARIQWVMRPPNISFD